MGEVLLPAHCKCHPVTWVERKNGVIPICDSYTEFRNLGLCEVCAHDRDCHYPSPAQEAKP